MSDEDAFTRDAERAMETEWTPERWEALPQPSDASVDVSGALATLREVPRDAWIDGPVNELGWRLDRVRALMYLMREVASDIELAMAEAMTEDEVEVPGLGLIKRRPVKRWTWRYDGAGEQMREDLRDAVATYVAVDIATGEVDVAKRNVARAALDTAFEAIPAFSSLKRAGERRLKLRIEDYRTASIHHEVTIGDLDP